MRHFYFRLILGIVFVACMIFSFVTMNIHFAVSFPELRSFSFRLLALEEPQR